jgi:hypothetical protein
MEIKKPIAVTLASAFALNCVGAGHGIQLFTDLPPLAAIANSSFTGSAYLPVYARPLYNTVTDDLIEAPVPEKDRTGQF